jgi:hypothetical protein
MKDKCAKIIIPIFKTVNPTACRIQYRQVARLILARTCPTLSTRPDRRRRHDARRTKQKAHQRWASRICSRIVGHQCYLQSVASLANRLYVDEITNRKPNRFSHLRGAYELFAPGINPSNPAHAQCVHRIVRYCLCAWDEAYRYHSHIGDDVTGQLYHLPRTSAICKLSEAGKNRPAQVRRLSCDARPQCRGTAE